MLRYSSRVRGTHTPLVRTRERSQRALLRGIYARLARAFGPQQWWPARSAFEMMLGAILTQATSWHNVEQAIGRLRQAGALSAQGVLRIAPGRLEALVHPAGYFRQKAQRIRRFTRWYVGRYRGQAVRMFATPWRQLRVILLAQQGVGPETADAILLYAGHQPVFVVDAYTQRVFGRHRVMTAPASYEAIQQLVMQVWPEDAARYNEFHALLVEVGKHYCHRRNPDCDHCPLGSLPHTIEV